ncbi:MAG: DUF4340 domain-containing protein, partial [Gammaproteobacteria bacterium]|nr:DUF4340 domain-containing protein [Gammaproteobacteria bacterium]
AEFKDDAPASYVPFQLDPPRMKITVLTEKTIPAKAKPGDPDTQPADLEPTKQEIAHELLVGGELDNPSGTKQYFARLADTPWLFTLNDYTYKQLAVDLGELQDKKLASVENHRVKSIKVDTPQGSLVLSKQVGGGWHDAENVAADEVAVDDLLRAVSGLQATNYVDPATELITIDWDQPRARVTLVEEGSLNPTTLLVGPPSASGRMVFVRNAAEEAVAAVREDAVAQLLAGPMAYRDRTVLRLDRARTNRIEISQAGQETVSLVQNNGEWSMAAPAQAPVDRESVRNLMQNLASLNARQVVSDGDRAAYGLDAPAVTVAAFVEPAATEPEATEAAATEAAPATETAADEPAEGAASEPAPAADAQAATEEAVTAEPAVAESAKPRVTKTIPERIKQIEELLEYQKTNPNENPLATQMLREELAKLEAAATQPENQASEAPATTDAQPAPAAEPSAPVAPEGPNVQRLHLARHQGRVYAAVDGNELIYELDEQVMKDITA